MTVEQHRSKHESFNFYTLTFANQFAKMAPACL